MSDNALPESLEYHLSNLVTYPYRNAPVTAGGAADAEIVLESLNELEGQLQEENRTEETYDFDSIRYALEQLKSYFHPNQQSALDDREASIFGFFVDRRVRELKEHT